MTFDLKCGDCLEIMKEMPDGSVDLVLTSPPYEAARTYGIDFKLRGQEFVDWCVERYLECYRISRGLVAWVIEGQTRDYRYSASPILIAADLHRKGVKLRKPPAFHRVGIPGSGGPDWLRNDYEFIICASHGRLPWSDNTACGHPPKWGPGGEMSYRQSDGTRRNQWGGSGSTNGSSNERKKDGSRKGKPRPSHVVAPLGESEPVISQAERGRIRAEKVAAGLGKVHKAIDSGEWADKETVQEWNYVPPVLANPGNVPQEKYTADQVGKLIMGLIGEPSDLQRHKVGGGLMGSKFAHENEAPFPLSLAEFFVKSFCPPDGTVLDPFCGSGTTIHAAAINGRHAIGIDVRESQIELTRRRMMDVLTK